MASTKQTALARARARRVELDRDRAARDNRVEQAAARVFVLLDERAAAERKIAAGNAGIGRELRALTGEGLAVEAVAELCDLEVADVRRLLRTPAGVGEGGAPAGTADSTATASVTHLRFAAGAEQAGESVGDQAAEAAASTGAG